MKNQNRGSKSANFETNTSKENLALAEATMMITQPEEKEVTEAEIQDAIVYPNGVTSIDFMMPEEEREILEKNLNIYSDVEAMQKTLNVAKKNKMLSEQLKTLELISKTDEFTTKMFELMTNPETLQVVEQYMQRQFEEGDPTKAIKQIGLTTKAMMDARKEMLSGLKAGNGGKKTRIALKFTNDSGEDFQLGAEIGGE